MNLRGGDILSTEFFTDEQYKGTGISLGLARGLLVRAGGLEITQEGMGLGNVAVRSGGRTYFAQESRVAWFSPQSVVIDYEIDTAFISGTGGRCDSLITIIRESLSCLYRMTPPMQKALLAAGTQLRRMLGIKERLVPVAPLALARFEYQLHPGRVDVSCDFTAIAELPEQLFIMNELGADFFHCARKGSQPAECPGGWQFCADPRNLPSFYSPQLDIGYSLGAISMEQQEPYKVFWGREKTADLCWAGFSIQICPARTGPTNIACSYSVIFENDEVKEGTDDR